MPRTPVDLPLSLRVGLNEVDRRLRRSALASGAGRLALGMALGAVFGIVLDLAFALASPARWVLLAVWVSMAVAGMAIWVLRPMIWRPGPTTLAAVIERHFPELQERLTSAVGLLEAGSQAHGSPRLIGTVVEEACSQLHDLDPGAAVPFRQSGIWLAVGSVAVLLVALPALLWPDPCAIAWQRFLAPWSHVDRIHVFIVTIPQGDRLVGLGEDVTIEAEVRSRLGSSRPPSPAPTSLEWTDLTGTRHRLPMTAVPGHPHRFRATLPQVASSSWFLVRHGSAESAVHRITAVAPPALAAVEVTVMAPTYMKLSDQSYHDPVRITAWEGSTVSLTMTATKPLREARLTWPGAGDTVHAWKDAPGVRWTVRVPARTTGAWAFAMTEEHGITSRPEPPRRIVVRADAPPTVAFREPEDGFKDATTDDTLATGVIAEDDLAVSAIEVHYAIYRGGSNTVTETGQARTTVPGLGTKQARGDATLPLHPLGLRPGDVLGYRLRALDSKPEPNTAWTPERRLTIVARAEPLQARRLAAERQRFQEQLAAIQRQAAENRQATEQLRYAADATQRNNAPWSPDQQAALQQQEDAAGEVVDRLHLLGRELAEHPAFAPLGPAAEQIAEAEAESGRAALDRAHETRDGGERLDALKQADGTMTALNQRLDELKKQLDRPPPPHTPARPGPETVQTPQAKPDGNPTNRSPRSMPGGTAEADLAALQAALNARRGRSWGELPGHLRTAILQLSQGRYRDDYARLIQLYYREIATAGTPQPTSIRSDPQPKN